MTDDTLSRAEEREVMAMRLPVMSLEDVLATKLLALTEQEPNYGPVLEIARTLREQIRWDEVRERTQDSPFAKAFFTLIEELGILPEHARTTARAGIAPAGRSGRLRIPRSWSAAEPRTARPPRRTASTRTTSRPRGRGWCGVDDLDAVAVTEPVRRGRVAYCTRISHG